MFAFPITYPELLKSMFWLMKWTELSQKTKLPPPECALLKPSPQELQPSEPTAVKSDFCVFGSGTWKLFPATGKRYALNCMLTRPRHSKTPQWQVPSGFRVPTQ